MNISVIIPAINEEQSIGRVIRDIPPELNAQVLVCNNGSSDHTAEKAREAGAIVLDEPKKGYGNACLKGMEYLTQQKGSTDVVVFIDGDYSDFPGQMPLLIKEIKAGYDLVIGSRALGKSEAGSMTIPQRFGNWLSGRLIWLLYRQNVTDLGPFRAISWNKLQALQMEDKTFGWTVEMQVKAIKKGYKYREVSVDYRKRIGKSKVSGTVKGTLLAGIKIIYTIFKYV